MGRSTNDLQARYAIVRCARVMGAAPIVQLQAEIAKRFFLAANARIDDNENFGQHATWRINGWDS